MEILAILLLFSTVAIYMLAKKLKEVLEVNKKLAAKNDELRRFLTAMNSELDSKDEELIDLALDPNSLIGVKYRTQAIIKENMRLRANEWNGDLTKLSAIELIAHELRMDKSNYIEKTVQNGVYTPNYWRAKKNQQPIAGGEQLFISCNVAPVDSLKIKGENKDLPTKTE